MGGVLLAGSVWAAPSREGEPVLLDRIVAVVLDEPITLYELKQAVAPQRAKLRHTIHDPEELQRKLDLVVEDALEGLIDDILVFHEAKELGIKVDSKRVSDHLENIRESNGWSKAELAFQLKQIGFNSIADYREHTEREMLKAQVIGAKVSSRIKVDEREVEQELDKQLGQKRTITERRASHILIKLPEDASPLELEEASEKLQRARDLVLTGQSSFSEEARRLSDDGTRRAGGDLGWFLPGDYHPDFEKVALETQLDHISEPFRTPFGLHIVTITGVRQKELNQEEDLEALKQQIRYRLRESKLASSYERWVQSLRQGVFIELRELGEDLQ